MRNDERGAGKWMIVVAFCRESGLGIPDRCTGNGFDFIGKGLIFLCTGVGQTRSSLIFARHGKVLYLDIGLQEFSSSLTCPVADGTFRGGRVLWCNR